MAFLSLALQLAAPAAFAQPVMQPPTVLKGRIVRLQVTNATPNRLVYFTVSTDGAGAGPCIGATGVCADILNPLIIGTAYSDSNGEAWLNVGVSPTIPAGTQTWFQAFPRSNPVISETNVVTATVTQPAYVRCYDPGVDAPVVRVPPVTQTTFEGYPLYYYMPPNPRGVIFYFHGGDEGPSEALKNEQIALLWNQMGANENFGIVATERTSQAPGTSWDWQSSPNQNADTQRLNRLRNWLITNTPMTNTTTTVMTGFSDGAGFATTFTNWARTNYGWPVAAAAAHNGAFGDTPSVPTIWHIAENDDPNAVQSISQLESAMTQAGRTYTRLDTPERTLTANMFLREPSWSLADGQAVIADLQSFGIINAQGVRVIPDNQIESQLDSWVANSSLTQATLAAARIRTVWATHRYSAYDAATECDFIRDLVP
ncbi:MAG: hypothetical protein H6735_24195 [Alphaproteobacteria bacterium]|nr:hypothetical protein [Alphaproteobacteria bacterium]